MPDKHLISYRTVYYHFPPLLYLAKHPWGVDSVVYAHCVLSAHWQSKQTHCQNVGWWHETDGFGLIQHWSKLNRVQIVSFKGKLLICEAAAGHRDKPSCSFDSVDVWGITFNVWIIIGKGSDLGADSRLCLIIIQRVWRGSIYWCVGVGVSVRVGFV